DRRERHPREHDRLHRARGGAARAQHGAGRRLRVAPLRGPHQRHVGQAARPLDLPARSRREPDDDHPGPRHPVRRPQPRRRVAVAQAAVEARDVTAALAARLGGIRWTSPRTVGIGGIVLGALAFWLALPPLASRTAVLPLAIGIVAIFAGIWAWTRDERRVGGGAVAAGLLGIVFGVLATRSSTAHLDTVVVWSALGAATLRYATPLTFAAIGGLYCERSGVVNVALEGMLLTGAFFGIWGAVWAHGWAGSAAWVVGLALGALAGMALAAIHAVWSIHLKVDQIISGTAINFLALGITGYLFIDKYGDTGTPGNVPDYGIPDVHIGFLSHWYFIGPIIGQLNLMIWLSIALLVFTYVLVFRTPFGLRLRAVGEHPRAADTVG